MLKPKEIEKLAIKYEAFGMGRVDEKGFTTHGFDPSGIKKFAAELMRLAYNEGLEDAAKYLVSTAEDFEQSATHVFEGVGPTGAGRRSQLRDELTVKAQLLRGQAIRLRESQKKASISRAKKI